MREREWMDTYVLPDRYHGLSYDPWDTVTESLSHLDLQNYKPKLTLLLITYQSNFMLL